MYKSMKIYGIRQYNRSFNVPNIWVGDESEVLMKRSFNYLIVVSDTLRYHYHLQYFFKAFLKTNFMTEQVKYINTLYKAFDTCATWQLVGNEIFCTSSWDTSHKNKYLWKKYVRYVTITLFPCNSECIKSNVKCACNELSIIISVLIYDFYHCVKAISDQSVLEIGIAI